MGSFIYNARQVNLFYCQIPIFRGLADGEFLKITKLSDSFTDKSGPDGDVVISVSGDTRYDITITLMQSSPHNDQLSQLHALQTSGINGQGIGEFHATDKTGRSMHRGPTCWIVKPPDGSYAKEAGTREWKLRAAFLNHFVGGNMQVGL